MHVFCPNCANLLIISKFPARSGGEGEGRHRFECRTCPYQYIIKKTVYETKSLERKEVEDVLGGRDAWENAETTDVACPNEKCTSSKAFFQQHQIRSADEPMTLFFKCVICARQWRE